MKINFLLICIFLMLAFSVAKSQNILSYGNNSVSKDEFVKAFSKNNNDEKISEKAYRDYLELYIRFKLKVKAAYDSKLDTLPNQKAELADFRRQVAEGFLIDPPSFQKLVVEAFDRSQKDIHLAHIYIPYTTVNNQNMVAYIDTSKALKLATAAYNELQKRSDFGNVAAIYSSDPSVSTNHGDIGYITVFTLPYPLENLAFSLPVNGFSKPYQTKAGYHIFKNLGERKAAGKIKAAQILIAFPANAGDEAKAVTKRRADSVYNALLHGVPFNEMVNKYGFGTGGLPASGELKEFSVGSFDAAFENVVFALSKNGDISKPIPTSIGYHIVQRIEQIPVVTTTTNDSAMAVLKQLVQNDRRMEDSRKVMLQKIYRLTGFQKTMFFENDLRLIADSLLRGKKTPKTSAITDKTMLFFFAGKKISVGDWIKYLQSKNINNTNAEKNYSSLLEQYQETMVQEYYRDHLEEYDQGFAAQVKEFKEGNLLFEIMQRKIWDKASADSSGQKSYFENNKSKYWWEPSAEAVIFNCSDSLTALAVKSGLELRKNKSWRAVIAPFEDKVQGDSGRFELTQLPLDQKDLPKPGMLTTPIKNNGDNTFSLAFIVKLYREKFPRDFENAKGFVLNDYQGYLEDKWITSLKQQYPIKINEDVFKTLLK